MVVVVVVELFLEEEEELHPPGIIIIFLAFVKSPIIVIILDLIYVFLCSFCIFSLYHCTCIQFCNIFEAYNGIICKYSATSAIIIIIIIFL